MDLQHFEILLPKLYEISFIKGWRNEWNGNGIICMLLKEEKKPPLSLTC